MTTVTSTIVTATATIAATAPGDQVYTLISVEDGNAEIANIGQQVTIHVSPTPTISAGPDHVVCVGDLVTFTPSGGVTYTWTNGLTGPFFEATVSGIQTYIVTGANQDGCQASDEVIVTVLPAPVFTATAVIDSAGCNDGSIALTVSGPGTYSVLWANGSTSAFLTSLLPGTYEATVTDQSGCSADVS